MAGVGGRGEDVGMLGGVWVEGCLVSNPKP